MIENFEEEFTAFVASKPIDERYNGGSIGKCALGQFVASRGYIGVTELFNRHSDT